MYGLTCVLYRSRLNETAVLIHIDKVDDITCAFIDAEFFIVVYQ